MPMFQGHVEKQEYGRGLRNHIRGLSKGSGIPEIKHWECDAEILNNIKAEKYSLELTLVRAILVKFRKPDCSREKIITMRVKSFKKYLTVKIVNEEFPTCLSIVSKKPVDRKRRGGGEVIGGARP